VDGICSTVVKAAPAFFEVEYVPETLARTTARSFEKGTLVNLERSLRWGDPIEGHIVQGHVEGRGIIAGILEMGKGRELTVALPAPLAKGTPLKGSLAVNGVSLTVARKRHRLVTLALIPYTLAHTNLGRLAVGDEVNIETDALARGWRSGSAWDRVTVHAPKRVRTRKKSR
jgi:riboflavin synthase alpha subunit